MKVRVRDARHVGTVGGLPDAHAISGEFLVDAMDGTFDGEENGVDGGFVHLSNIRVVMPRRDKQVAVPVLAQIQ